MLSFAEASDRVSTVLAMYKFSSENNYKGKNTAAVGWMAIEEGAWAVCVCISYTGNGGQLGCSFLWNGRGGWGGQGNCRKSYQSNDKWSRG